MLKVGSVLGRYELMAHLRNGGMAALYLGRRVEPADNRIFAVKVVHPHLLDDEDLVQMFLDEAGLSVRIEHPNVVRVEEVGEDRGRHFIAMEYIHGCSLAQLLQALIERQRRMSPELAVFIAMSVADGLHAAHELAGDNGEPLRVVHRDVSPQNILLSHTGEVRLIDFGIAKSRMHVHHSQTGTSIRGKLRYMAPEHARGQSVDRRTDVYALAIVLWEMLTMRPLFWADSDFSVLMSVRDPEIIPPSRYAPRVGEDLDRALLSALHTDSDRRPRTARAFRGLLARAVPFASALGEDHVAELLHLVLGDEMTRRMDELPHIAFPDGSHTDRGTLSLRPGHDGKVLDTLTHPGAEATLLRETLSEEAAEQEPYVPPEPQSDGLSRLNGYEPEEATELMSGDEIRAVHEALSRIRQRSLSESRVAAARRAASPSGAPVAGVEPEPGGRAPSSYGSPVGGAVGLAPVAAGWSGRSEPPPADPALIPSLAEGERVSSASRPAAAELRPGSDRDARFDDPEQDSRADADEAGYQALLAVAAVLGLLLAAAAGFLLW